MKKLLLLTLITLNLFALGKKPCVDPVTTINWGFFFDDLLLGKWGDGMDRLSDEDGDGDGKSDGGGLCFCDKTSDGTPDAGMKIRLTEPIAFLELTSTPYKFPCFQGDSGKGGIARIKKRGTPESYRNGHYIQYPVFALLNFATDQLCVSDEFPLDLPFLGEVLPNWYDDFTASMLGPWKLLFANPIAQLACLWDCATSTYGKPTEFLTWCNGCWQPRIIDTGKPFKGNPPQSDAALAVAMMNWQHIGYSLPQTIEIPATSMPGAKGGVFRSANDIACGKVINYFPLVIKNQYKLQIAYPTSTDDMITLG